MERGDLIKFVRAHAKIREQTHSLPKEWSLEERTNKAKNVSNVIMGLITDSEYVANAIKNADITKGVCSIHCYVSLSMALATGHSNHVGAMLDDQFDNIPGSCVVIGPERTSSIIHNNIEAIKFFKKSHIEYEKKGLVPVLVHLEIVLNDLGPADTDTIQQVGGYYFTKHGVESPLDNTTAFRKCVKGYDSEIDEALKNPDIAQHFMDYFKHLQATNPENTHSYISDEEIRKVNQCIAKNTKFCDTCNKAGYSFKRCGRCKKTIYCSRECQKKDWKTHKKNCLK
jgi:hypothetical protein